MVPTLIAICLILSSAAGVWALIRKWQRNIERGPPLIEAPPKRSDPMHGALYESGLIRPGPAALPAAPPLPAGFQCRWSAAVPGSPPLALLWAEGPVGAVGQGGLAAVGWPVAGEPHRWAQLPETRAAYADLGQFGGGFELQPTASHAWLLHPHPTPPLAFDLLCHLAAASWLATPADRRELPHQTGDLLPISWTEDKWQYGSLPPFGRLRVTADALVLQAPSRLPGADDAGRAVGQPCFQPFERQLGRSDLRVVAGEGDAMALHASDGVVEATLLTGALGPALADLGLPTEAADATTAETAIDEEP